MLANYKHKHCNNICNFPTKYSFFQYYCKYYDVILYCKINITKTCAFNKNNKACYEKFFLRGLPF